MQVRFVLPRLPWRVFVALALPLPPALATPLSAQDDSGSRLTIELFQGAAFGAAGNLRPYQAGIAYLRVGPSTRPVWGEAGPRL